MAIINNFFPRERLDYYTKPQGLDKEPKLPPKLAGPLHKIITTTNLHPVKVAPGLLYLPSRPATPSVQTVLTPWGRNCLGRVLQRRGLLQAPLSAWVIAGVHSVNVRSRWGKPREAWQKARRGSGSLSLLGLTPRHRSRQPGSSPERVGIV